MATRTRYTSVPALLLLLAACGRSGAKPGAPADLAPGEAPSAEQVRLLLRTGAGAGAYTHPGAADTTLRPHAYKGPPGLLQQAVALGLAEDASWELVGANDSVLYIRRTDTLTSAQDELLVLLEARGDSTLLYARSATLMGASDDDRHRQNIADLWAGLGRFRTVRPAAAGQAPAHGDGGLPPSHPTTEPGLPPGHPSTAPSLPPGHPPAGAAPRPNG